MSKTTEDDVAFIRALAELLRETDLTEIEVEREYGEDDELKVRLSRATLAAPAPAAAPAAPAPAPAPAAPAPAPQPAAPTHAADEDHPGTVTSPMVGTVYLASDPGSAPFVQVGDTVSEGQTLVIIEAMKTMNQIPAPRAGKVVKILVANAEPVEFGAPLMIIE